ncbi:MAG: hypothetical protein WCO56_29655 [Verrucomicrobiota bacterium]
MPQSKFLSVKRIGIYSPSLHPGLAAVIKALLDDGKDVTLHVKRKPEGETVDHDVTLSVLAQQPNLLICDLADDPDREYDLLIVGWSHWLRFAAEDLRTLRRRVARARRVILFYDAQFGHYWQMLLQQGRAWLQNRDWLGRVESVCYATIFPRADCWSFVRRRYPLAVGPNLHFLFETLAQQEMARPWQVEKKRGFVLAATGARGPYRAALCDHLLGLFARNSSLRVCDSGQAPGGDRPAVAWTVNGTRPTIAEYVRLLDDTDFLICLPGTSWTQRPFEALTRGAIPILDADNMNMHDIPWKDGVNCLIVKQPKSFACWTQVIGRALSTPQQRC